MMIRRYCNGSHAVMNPHYCGSVIPKYPTSIIEYPKPTEEHSIESNVGNSNVRNPNILSIFSKGAFPKRPFYDILNLLQMSRLPERGSV